MFCSQNLLTTRTEGHSKSKYQSKHRLYNCHDFIWNFHHQPAMTFPLHTRRHSQTRIVDLIHTCAWQLDTMHTHSHTTMHTRVRPASKWRGRVTKGHPTMEVPPWSRASMIPQTADDRVVFVYLPLKYWTSRQRIIAIFMAWWAFLLILFQFKEAVNAIMLWIVRCESHERIGRVTISLRSCRWCFFVALPSIICPFRIRLESETSRAEPPDRGCRVNPTLKPVFRSAETGETERLREWQWNGKIR
jgi:hypothetical protein